MLLIGGNRQIGTVFGVHLRHVGRGCAKLLCHDPVPLLLVTQCGLAVVDSGDRSTTRLVKQRSPRLGRSHGAGMVSTGLPARLGGAFVADRPLNQVIGVDLQGLLVHCHYATPSRCSKRSLKLSAAPVRAPLPAPARWPLRSPLSL